MVLKLEICSDVPIDRAREIEALEKKVFSKQDRWAGLKEEVARRNTFICFAEAPPCGDEQSRVIGYAVFTVNSLVVHVAKIAVDPERRRAGVGTALLQACLAMATSQRRAMAATLHVGVANEPAVALYRSVGFEVDATLPDYYAQGRDAYKMACDLRGERASAFLKAPPRGEQGAAHAAGGTSSVRRTRQHKQ